jgi:ribosomal protein S18 acetylase RimI-like enzyme
VNPASKRVAIRDATLADTEAIAALHVASWRSAYQGIVPDGFLESITRESRIVRWRNALSSAESPHTETVVAVDGGEIRGFCSFGPRREPASSEVGEVYALHVHPSLRRSGIGTLLLEAALRRLAVRDRVAAVLWVLRDNVSARTFYEARGWSATGEEMVEHRSGFAIPETRYTIALDLPG